MGTISGYQGKTMGGQAASQDARLQATLDRLRKKKSGGAEKKKKVAKKPPAEEAKPTKEVATFQKGADKAEAFAKKGEKKSLPSGLAGAEGYTGKRGGGLMAQIAALTGKEPDTGRVHKGDVTVRSANDLEQLRGVTVLEGSLDIAETALTAADLDALQTLTAIHGNFTLEGNAQLTSLDALANLHSVEGSFYLGYNDALQSGRLPKLEQTGTVIVEGHDALRTLELPALTTVARYAHLHENDALESFSAPKLGALGGELSLLDNPALARVDVAALATSDARPALEASGNDALAALPY